LLGNFHRANKFSRVKERFRDRGSSYGESTAIIKTNLCEEDNLLSLHTCEASLVPEFPFLRVPFGSNKNINPCLIFINWFTVAIIQNQLNYLLPFWFRQ